MFKTAILCVTNPATGVKKAVKKNITDGFIIFVVGILLAALLSGVSAILSYEASTAMYAYYGMEMPSQFEVFTESFISTISGLIISILGILVSIYIIMRALGHKKKILKFFGGLAFPFAAINVFIGLIEVLSVLTITNIGTDMGFLIGIFGYLFFLVLLYSYIAYTLLVKEFFKTSLEKAASVMLLTVLVLNIGSLMSMLGGSVGGLA